MSTLPAVAAWRHVDARAGFEVLFLRRRPNGYDLKGHSTGIENGEAWGIRYALKLNTSWATRSAHIVGLSELGAHEVWLEGDANGEWRIDGRQAPQLSGCFDVDLEASACTNAFPVNRLGLTVGQEADAPAAYVRAADLGVKCLEQRYARLEDDGERSRYDYAAPEFDFRCVLVHDKFGLVLDYPGIASG